jgi:glyoxylase-like metal-dependent hydrolase (beta-lactamase superfamily II)
MTEHNLQQVTPHVWWMPPGKPDRPSLCAVVGERGTLMLDSGASDAHARLFLDALAANGVPAPRLIAFTHWHWDHTFGAAEVGAPVIAHRLTAQKVAEMARASWDDEAMTQRVEAGTGMPTPGGMKDIQEEYPNPRHVRFAEVDIVFEDSLLIDMGGVTCRIQHVGGDHTEDGCIMHVVEDGLVFLGDTLYPCIYPQYYYKPHNILSLVDAIAACNAEHMIEGHRPKVLTQAESTALFGKIHAATALAQAMPDADIPTILGAAAQQGIDVSDMEFSGIVGVLVMGRGV